jgi:hypothetical protein
MDQREKDLAIRQAIHERLLKRASSDLDFRRLLIDNPKSALARELGMDIPDHVHVTVLPESEDHLFIVIPPLSGEAGSTGVAKLAKSGSAYAGPAYAGPARTGIDRLAQGGSQGYGSAYAGPAYAGAPRTGIDRLAQGGSQGYGSAYAGPAYAGPARTGINRLADLSPAYGSKRTPKK